jgi:hypothetical protein
MDKEFETLLESGLLSVPPGFTERVMRDIGSSPLPVWQSNRWERLQWLALLSGAALGAFELTTFIFGIWAAATAS